MAWGRRDGPPGTWWVIGKHWGGLVMVDGRNPNSRGCPGSSQSPKTYGTVAAGPPLCEQQGAADAFGSCWGLWGLSVAGKERSSNPPHIWRPQLSLTLPTAETWAGLGPAPQLRGCQVMVLQMPLLGGGPGGGHRPQPGGGHRPQPG